MRLPRLALVVFIAAGVAGCGSGANHRAALGTFGVAPGLHGSMLVSVRAVPSGRALHEGGATIVVASTVLGFAVTV
jgi:hypothetical protein